MLEVGAGDGRLTHFLQRALQKAPEHSTSAIASAQQPADGGRVLPHRASSDRVEKRTSDGGCVSGGHGSAASGWLQAAPAAQATAAPPLKGQCYSSQHPGPAPRETPATMSAAQDPAGTDNRSGPSAAEQQRPLISVSASDSGSLGLHASSPFRCNVASSFAAAHLLLPHKQAIGCVAVQAMYEVHC